MIDSNPQTFVRASFHSELLKIDEWFRAKKLTTINGESKKVEFGKNAVRKF